MKKIIIATVFLIGLHTNVFLGSPFPPELMEILDEDDKPEKVEEDLRSAVFFSAMVDDIKEVIDVIERISRNRSLDMSRLRFKSLLKNPHYKKKLVELSCEVGVFSGRKRFFIRKIEMLEDDGAIPLEKKIPLDELVPVPDGMLSEALITAAEEGSVKVLRFLLKKGADPSYRNKSGEVAIKVAFDNEEKEIVQILMEYDMEEGIELCNNEWSVENGKVVVKIASH